MSISVSFYGNKRPAPNVKPQRTVNYPDNTPPEKLPFGKKNPVDWMTGKHLVQLKKEAESGGNAANIPDGDKAGEILYWDGSEWQRSYVAGIASGSVLLWDGSKYRSVALEQVTCVVDWRVDKAGHVFQVKTRSFYVLLADSPSDWTNISDANGGLLEEG